MQSPFTLSNPRVTFRPLLRIIAKGRCAGKTHDLVMAALDDPQSIIMVISASERDRIHRLYGFPLHRIVTPGMQTTRGRDCNLYIDNAEMVLETLFGAPIAGVTFNSQ